MLRQYPVDKKGKEHVIRFALEGWNIGDFYGLISGELTTCNTDILEETEFPVR